MKKYSPGDEAPVGIYLSIRHVDLRVLNAGEGSLKGKAGARYVRVPLPLLIVMTPVIGGIFSMAFPLVIFGAFAVVIKERFLRVRTCRAGDTVDWGIYIGLNRLTLKYGERVGRDHARRVGDTVRSSAHVAGRGLQPGDWWPLRRNVPVDPGDRDDSDARSPARGRRPVRSGRASLNGKDTSLACAGSPLRPTSTRRRGG